MRGLRLLIRPTSAGDVQDVRAFLVGQGVADPVPATGLLAKMLGRIVAVAGFTLLDDGLRVDSLVVSHELRSKRIGREMVRELRELAAKLDRKQLFATRDAVAASADADEFLRRVGFIKQEDRWVLAAG